MNKLMKIENIEVVQGIIKFPEYEKLKKEAADVAEFVKNIKVDEENIKESKKLLAAVNKSISKLEDKRKAVKKEVMKPYQDFETQVKEIVEIVKDADEIVRNQVKTLEEKEREEKRNSLQEIWNLRIEQYEYAKIMSFDDWITPQHLNKTLTIKKAEEDMVEFLEKSERDLQVLSGMEHKDDLIIEYKNTKDVGMTITAVKMREKYKAENKKLLDENIEEEKTYVFKVFNEKDMKLVELLLKEQDIEFERV